MLSSRFDRWLAGSICTDVSVPSIIEEEFVLSWRTQHKPLVNRYFSSQVNFRIPAGGRGSMDG